MEANFVVLVDHGVSWGIRDISPVGFHTLQEAKRFEEDVRLNGSPSIEGVYRLDLISENTFRKQRNWHTTEAPA